MYKPIIFILLSMLIDSCHMGNKREEQQNKGQFLVAADIRIIPDDSPLFQRIKLQRVSSGKYHAHYNTTGTVKVITGALAELATPFAGRITKSYIHLGQQVVAGSPIFEIYSPDYFETVKAFVQSKQERQLAVSNFNRQKELFEHGVGSKKELDEAEAVAQIAGRDYEKAESSLLIFNVKPDEISLGKPLVVRSPIAGEIVENNLVVGQYLKSDASSQAVVADLKKVWVVAQVKEKNIGLINSIDSVHVVTDAHPDHTINGIVTYTGSLLDEQTRSVEVFIECNNHQKFLKPGMFANVAFTSQLSDVLVIPACALLQEEERTFLFVQTDKNKFSKREVTVLTGNEKELIVSSGLKSDETIVTEGAIYLR